MGQICDYVIVRVFGMAVGGRNVGDRNVGYSDQFLSVENNHHGGTRWSLTLSQTLLSAGINHDKFPTKLLILLNYLSCGTTVDDSSVDNGQSE